MAKPRTTLQTLLEEVSGFGDQSVAFQPGEDAKLTYPAIVYEIDNTYVEHADNSPYMWCLRYQVTLIHRDPDSDVFNKLVALPLCAFQRHFATSGLNHDVFVIYH